MSADSQPIEALDGETRLLGQAGRWHTRNPIVKRSAAGFTGFTGFVGTETLGSRAMRDWLDAFGGKHATATLADYATALGAELTVEWNRLRLVSVLEILISGVEHGDVQFWFVRNSDGLNADGTYRAPKTEFDVVNDFDVNYVPNDLRPGQTKEQLLSERIYSFRQGALFPAAAIFDVFQDILGMLYAQGIAGFKPVASLDDLGYFARQRLEFVKRLYSKKHGIYSNPVPPIGGKVHVLGVGRDGVTREYSKNRCSREEALVLPGAAGAGGAPSSLRREARTTSAGRSSADARASASVASSVFRTARSPPACGPPPSPSLATSSSARARSGSAGASSKISSWRAGSTSTSVRFAGIATLAGCQTELANHSPGPCHGANRHAGTPSPRMLNRRQPTSLTHLDSRRDTDASFRCGASTRSRRPRLVRLV
jgi:hypothetical protein